MASQSVRQHQREPARSCAPGLCFNTAAPGGQEHCSDPQEGRAGCSDPLGQSTSAGGHPSTHYDASDPMQQPAARGQERVPLAITAASGHPCTHRHHRTPMGSHRQEPGAHDGPRWTTARCGSGPECRVSTWQGEPLLLARHHRAAARAQSRERAAHQAPAEVPAAASTPQPFEASRSQPSWSPGSLPTASPRFKQRAHFSQPCKANK